MKKTQAQIIATIGPSSSNTRILYEMMSHKMSVARLNFAWGDFEEHKKHIDLVREAEEKAEVKIPIIVDLPGPRIQKTKGHTYDKDEISLLTKEDESYIQFGIENNVDYFALSFVGNKKDVFECREIIKKLGGKQLIISKIERKKALENLEEIIEVSDAIMVARGDLGEEIPLETMPFVQNMIIKKTKQAGKPVITATQMMLSMTEHDTPTRAEVTDVANAILQGSDVVMLSEETASGKYPVETVTMMEKIILEAEKHMPDEHINLLQCLK